MQGVQKAPPCTSRARQPPMAASEPTLGTGRGAQLASPGQRALPAPCDSGLWARSRLFGHGESGARAAWAVPPFPARAGPPRGRCLVPVGGAGVVERPGCGLRDCGAAGLRGRAGLCGPGEGGAPGGPELPPAGGRILCVGGLGLRWDPHTVGSRAA